MGDADPLTPPDAMDTALTDLRAGGFAALLDPDPTRYAAPQAFAATLRAEGGDGIVYPSQRHEGGACIAAFWPDVVTAPVQGDHYRYHWDGQRIDYARRMSGDRLTYALALKA